MAYNKIEYDNNMIKERYDRINFTAPKGWKEIIAKRSKEKGFKYPGEYIKDLIEKDLKLSDNEGGVIEFSKFFCKKSPNGYFYT